MIKLTRRLTLIISSLFRASTVLSAEPPTEAIHDSKSSQTSADQILRQRLKDAGVYSVADSAEATWSRGTDQD